MAVNAKLRVLPIDAVMHQISDGLKEASSLVLRAETGAGKTTRVPPALLDAGFADRGQIVLLEPRRVAARAATRRIAEEQGWKVGGAVGYAIRFDRRASADTRILVVTEGVLLRMLQRDPFLSDVSVVIFDEFHERRLDSDLALAMVRSIQREVNPELRVVVMSATIDTEEIVRYLRPATTVECEGRRHPIDVEYLSEPDDRPIPIVAAEGVRRALSRSDSDVLAFLPGVAEIRRTEAELTQIVRGRDVLVLPLFGALPAEKQDVVLLPSRRQKVVLATNVAETSLTIEGIGTVVDTGFAKVPIFDTGCGLDRLESVRISRSSADQRTGRAGRLGPGVALRLWTRAQHDCLSDHSTPDVQRVDLSRAVLELFAWGERDIGAFGWFERPPEDAIVRAVNLLRRLGAIDSSGLTEVGCLMARLPIQPRLARLVIEANRLGHLAEGAAAAALLSERDPLRGAAGSSRGNQSRSSSDVLVRLDWMRGQGSLGRSVSSGLVQQYHRAKNHLTSLAKRHLPVAGSQTLEADEAILRALFCAFKDHLAVRRSPQSSRAVMVGGRGVRLAPTSTVLDAPFFVSIELDAGKRGKRAESIARQASAVEMGWFAPSDLRTVVSLSFDPQQKRVSAVREVCFDDLVLSSQPAHIEDAQAASRCLAVAAADNLTDALGLDVPDTAQFLARMAFIRRSLPEVDFPGPIEELIVEVLPTLCTGRTSFAQLRKAPLLGCLAGMLSYEHRDILEREAPERLEVANGNSFRIRYEVGRPPILAARIQQLFGVNETPRIARGRVPVLLHLLAPNMRPQQITDDLAGFWDNTYSQVRKELRQRYPKHAWPEETNSE